MCLKSLSIEQLKQGVRRCEDRLAWNSFGIMRTEARVRAALREYRNELQRRRVLELDLKIE